MTRAGLIALLLLAGPAFAAEPRTVTLGAERMTCAACPIIVRKALSHVAGVSASTVDIKAHTATATFDPTEALATAVSQAGFPATVLSSGS